MILVNDLLSSLIVHKDGQWSVGDILDSTALTTETYQQKYLQQLQTGRRQWEEKLQYQTPKEGEDELQHIIERLRRDLLQKETEKTSALQEKKKERQTVREKTAALQEKDRIIREKEEELQLSHQQLEEKETTIQEKEQQFHQVQETVRIQQELLQTQRNHWMIDREEVIMTQEVLGQGAYGNVKVGIFRGLRVAVKSLHNLIISDYNLALFSREMDIASRVRHPNLVQFIGATKVGNPLILTELMTTSLYKELQKKGPLPRPQIVSISCDVALGLNYLHLWKPDPIIHRDVSSPNVLLEPSVGGMFKAKVTDYGTANLQRLARTDMPGNPAYAAPEVTLILMITVLQWMSIVTVYFLWR